MRNIFAKLFGDNQGVIKSLQPTLEKIDQYYHDLSKLSDTDLKAQTDLLKQKLAGTSLDQILPEAFATVQVASERWLGMKHYPVQLIGGIILHRGQVAEMKTGEGKTLVATLPIYLNALTGKGVHLVTVNDYLARRDAGWMAAIYHNLGLSVSVIISQQSFIYDPEYQSDQELVDPRLAHLRPVTRQQAYRADITYGINNEFGFDYLRDNMVAEESQISQRGHNFAIIDEVDSILIDEARTPLIISQPSQKADQKLSSFAKFVRVLKPEIDYKHDEKLKTATLTSDGMSKLEGFLGVENLYQPELVGDIHLVEQALRAEVAYKKDKDYVVASDGEIVIVDEFTGRMLAGRRFSEGLHQAIEAKEGVEIQNGSDTLATISFQNYFRMYDKLSGMTGTALTEAEEFGKIYDLEVVGIPTNQAISRIDRTDLIYKSSEEKYQAIIEEIKQRQAKGQPVLIGTSSIERNEFLASMMEDAGIKFAKLNAKNNQSEALIVAEAGQIGAVTLATNIAGRGTDIVLSEQAKQLGGLFVLGTERHESRRIDNQLRGRSGRQGDPGESRFFVSLEDDLMRIFGGDKLKSLMNTLGAEHGQAIENRMISKSIENAQKKVEGHNFDTRKHLVEYDDILNKQREIVYRWRRFYLGITTDRPKQVKDIKGLLEWYSQEIAGSSIDYQTQKFDATKFGQLLRDFLGKDYPESKEIFKQSLAGKLAEQLSQEHYQALVDKYTQEVVDQMVAQLSISILDQAWIDHLRAIDHLRDGIGLRGYGQRDPLVEYKQESFRLFEQFLIGVERTIARTIFHVQIRGHQESEIESAESGSDTDTNKQTIPGQLKGQDLSSLSRAERRRLKRSR
ncbi:preprotein translocase subunit SecA [Candidatus Saccharibacteria bacterium]|nr:preprotein translocase subunit SecA [Candidatus Saccharibacteria bacterium]